MKKCNDTIRVRCDTLRHAISKHATAFNTTPYCTVSDDTMWFDYNSTGGDESALPCDSYKYGETAAWPDMPLIGPFRQGRKIQVSICFSFLKFSVDKIAIGLHLLETLADFFFVWRSIGFLSFDCCFITCPVRSWQTQQTKGWKEPIKRTGTPV